MGAAQGFRPNVGKPLISQIGSAIQELDRGAQQNAALVEQTATAAGQLKNQASALAETVAVFKLPAAVPGG
jgi:methyl-accepting chemotaxis protein